jgi:hypothetical protein
LWVLLPAVESRLAPLPAGVDGFPVALLRVIRETGFELGKQQVGGNVRRDDSISSSYRTSNR